MKKGGFIAALKEAKEALTAVLFLLGIVGTVGGWLFQYGLHWIDRRQEERFAPLVDVMLYDLEKRGVLKDYRQYKAHLDSNRTLFDQRDAAALPYPLMRARPN